MTLPPNFMQAQINMSQSPRKIGALLHGLRASIREHEQSQHAVFQIGPYAFRPAAKIMVDMETEKKVRLTDKGNRHREIFVPRGRARC